MIRNKRRLSPPWVVALFAFGLFGVVAITSSNTRSNNAQCVFQPGDTISLKHGPKVQVVSSNAQGLFDSNPAKCRYWVKWYTTEGKLEEDLVRPHEIGTRSGESF